MCRFAAYAGPPIRLASLVTEPTHGIIHQSIDSREAIDTFNGDGYGLAWYAPRLQPEPVIFREITPAWNSPNLHSLARGVESSTVFAHVRAATEGLAVTLPNCHPFGRGPLAFMHNGLVGGFARLRRALRARLSDAAYDAILGTTDSEHLFAWFCDHWDRSTDADPLQRIATALEATFAALADLRRERGVEDVCRLNVAITDGVRIVASRFNLGEGGQVHSLYVHHGRNVCAEGAAGAAPSGDAGPCVIIASEPLFSDGDWQRVPEAHLVLVDEHRAVTVRPLHAGQRAPKTRP